MDLVDLLLNYAALLLWVAWRATGFDRGPGGRAPFSALLPSGSATPGRRHGYLVALAVVVVGRSWIYWRLGSEVNWVAGLDLGILSLSFNSAAWSRMLLYSVLEFVALWFAFHLWLLLLSIVNRALPDTDLWQRSVRRHLGWIEAWPAVLKLVAPWIIVAAVWVVANPLLADLGLAVRPKVTLHLWQQGVLVGIGTCVVWKHLIGLVLLLHVLNSYLYLGNRPFWSFINATARHLLRPIRWMPLRAGRVDLTPVVAIAAGYLGFGLLEMGLHRWFERIPW